MTKVTLQPIPQKQKIPRDYEHLYTYKLENLEEMNTFLEKHHFPRLNHKEIETLYRSISYKIQSVIRKKPYQLQKALDQMDSKPNSARHTEKSWYQSY